MSRNRTHTRPRLFVYVNQVYPDDYTGQGTFERELIRALGQRARRDTGVAFRVFSVRRPGSTPPRSSDTTFVPLDKRRPMSYIVHQLRLFVTLAWCLCRYWRYDVTIFARYAPTSVAPVLLSLVRRCPLVVRTGPALRDLAPYGRHPSRLTFAVIRAGFWLNCRAAKSIIVVTTQVKRAIEGWWPFTADKIMIVPNGANLTHFRPRPPDRAAWGLTDDGLVLGFVGRIYEDQGLDTAIRALARIQHETGDAPQMLIVGDGPCLEPWKALAQELGVGSRVVFAGQRPYTEMPSAIAACDVMLAPFTRHTFESTGSSSLKLFEYLACDKPVLAARGDDHEFLARNGVGVLVEPEDVDAWTRAFRKLMREPTWHLSGRGRRLVEQQYGFERVAADIWEACLGGHDAPTGQLVNARG
jgi:glycosyltransferase involved in cell wall biosynthesis